MQDPMDQFLSALRGLEKVKTPLSVETPTLTSGTAVSGSSKQQAYDPNEPETREMGFREEALRRLKVLQLPKAQQGTTKQDKA
jgi:hypothetical protein